MEEYLKIGQLGCDYNDTTVKVIDIGPLADVLKKLQDLTDQETANEELEMLKEVTLPDFNKKYYLTQVVEDNTSVPVKKDSYALYPYEYDYANYYGISTFEEF